MKNQTSLIKVPKLCRQIPLKNARASNEKIRLGDVRD